MLTLLYHNIVSERVNDVPVAGGQVTLETFRRHVEHFRSKLLNPFEVHRQLQRGETPRGVLLTFDDGAAGIIAAGRVLAEVGAVGVAFICPGTIAEGLWFYRLADSIVRATASRIRWQGFDLSLTEKKEKLRSYRALSQALFDLAPSVRDESLAEIVELLGVSPGAPAPALATVDEGALRQAEQTSALVFANHSWSHPNLSKLGPAELAYEVEEAESWLRSSGLPTLPWFAFPRGNHDARVRKAVARCCSVAFGASAYENGSGVLARTYICELDANFFRFGVKTAWEGRLRRTFSL